MNKLIIANLLISLVFPNLSWSSCSDSEYRCIEESKIKETVLREHFISLKTPPNPNIVWALSFGRDNTVPDEFFNQISDINLIFSSAKYYTPENVIPCEDGYLCDKKTNQKIMVIILDVLEWLSDLEVKIEKGYVSGQYSAGKSIYLYKKIDGIWKNVKTLAIGIS